jgi:hypothetical protein
MWQMLTDTVLKSEGLRILAENLGIVETERFVSLILREPFDYTEWRENLYKDVPLKKFLDDAVEYRKKQNEIS